MHAPTEHMRAIAGKVLDPNGDAMLRSNYSAKMQSHMLALGVDPTRDVHDILDMGAASGLSSCELMRAFPGAYVTGVDLSPHFLAVGRCAGTQAGVGTRATGGGAA